MFMFPVINSTQQGLHLLYVNDCEHYIDGLVQDCSIASALAMEILQSCTKPSIYRLCIIILRTFLQSLAENMIHEWFLKGKHRYNLSPQVTNLMMLNAEDLHHYAVF